MSENQAALADVRDRIDAIDRQFARTFEPARGLRTGRWRT